MSYKYSSLPTPTHTRLLVLRRDSSNDLRGELHVVSLGQELVYNCLSYCWNGPRSHDVDVAWTTPTRSIILDGIETPIRSNLYNALRSLRDLGLLVEPIWVDALCINQADSGERSSQVSQMASIYSGARDVLVWLGEEEAGTRLAVESMSRLSFTPEDIIAQQVAPHWQQPTDGRDFECVRKEFVRCKFTDLQFAAMIRFFVGNVWFSRVWTLQEMLLARQIRFVCGRVEAPLELVWRGSAIVAVYSAASSIWSEVHQLPGFAWPRMFFDDILAQRIDKWGGGEPSSIGIMAHKHRKRDATDPRDKVFGLLAMSKTSTKTHIKSVVADYSQTVQAVFTRAAIFGLLAWGGWETLSFVGDRTENKVPGLPSWVPDYTQEISWTPLQRSPCNFTATPSSQTVFSYEEEWPGCLVAPYHHLDTIAAVCPAHWDPDDPGSYNGIVDAFKLVLSPFPVETKGTDDIAAVLARTLTADKPIARTNTGTSHVRAEFINMAYCQLWHAIRDKDASLANRLLEGAGEPQVLVDALDAVGIRTHLNLLAESLEIGRKRAQHRSEDELSLSARGLERAADDIAQYASTTRVAIRLDWEATAKNRCLFRTQGGRLGLGPRTTKVGDRVGVLQGAQVPYVFRHQDKDIETILDLVGESYVYGIMNGELEEAGNLEYTKITLY
ncbi:heterokaryon incompatibility protein-domain-containing protein [Podospora aff. communis PSN243]|uniref:Heterokaryon incompatibility protein-domain-containing protein n=1 Tax=Podospora aff. communis PSN243 TaxID=3040156 RepID=A0AAV9GC63_9PEZI|nr:heterokaryon incompatibility protein-domain-containing protein [Podospora aff. communis PSN243]